jgi:hemerythrin-like domain-containing protein
MGQSNRIAKPHLQKHSASVIRVKWFKIESGKRVFVNIFLFVYNFAENFDGCHGIHDDHPKNDDVLFSRMLSL